MDHNLDLAAAFIAIAVLGVAYGSFGHGRLQDARQFADDALASERAAQSSFCETVSTTTEQADFDDITAFRRDPAILTSMTGNSARVRLRQRRPHRAEYHQRSTDFKPRIILLDFSLNDGSWCIADIITPD